MESAWKEGLIKKYGTYKTESGSYSITVSETPKGILNYVAKTQEGNALIISDEEASIYQRWSLYWDSSTAYLWVHSSDVGVFVWRPEDSGKYKKEAVDNLESMPRAIYMELPSSLHKISEKKYN